MSKIRLCIFDFDGTLGNTVNVILNTLKATFKEMGLQEKTDEEYQSTIGLPLEECFSTLVTMSEARAKECAATYRRIFPSFDTENAVTLFPNVLETLERLKADGIIIAIASSRRHVSLENYVNRLGLKSLVSSAVGADDVKHAKPHPEPVETLLATFGIKPNECLVIGDAPYDIIMGKSAGCLTCAVSYGNGTIEELKAAGADHIINDMGDLLLYM